MITVPGAPLGGAASLYTAEYRGALVVSVSWCMTSVMGRALCPLGVKVTDEIARSVLPQFHETPTRSSRLLPVPVVWAKLRLLAVGAPVPVSTAPSITTAPAGMTLKLAVTVLAASTVTVVEAELGLVTPVPLQPVNW